MINTIKILAPGRNCRKVKRILKAIESFLSVNNYSAEFIFVTTVDDFVDYKTWILPTIVMNDIIVSRGYIPLERDMISCLKK